MGAKAKWLFGHLVFTFFADLVALGAIDALLLLKYGRLPF